MRTLKKSLSLVLVLAMVFSFCVMGTNAAFADADEITVDYAEAVEVMNALEILKGDETGFRPADTLTRAEACVIIIKMLGELDFAKAAKTDKFDDISGHWAEKYIAYCAEQGLISGLGDGKFGPDSELSGYAFALMILRAVGYNPSVEGIGGADWELDTAKYAKKVGLIADMSLISAETFTREMAAQMAFDGLMGLGQVTYSGGTTTTINGVTVVTGGSISAPGATLYADTFRGNEQLILVTNNDANDSTALGTTTGYEVSYNPVTGDATVSATPAVFNIATGVEEIGHVINVYYATAGATGVAYKTVDYSTEVTVTAATALTAGTKAQVTALLGFAPLATMTAAADYSDYTYGAGSAQITVAAGAYTVPAGTYVFFGDEVIYMSETPYVDQFNFAWDNYDKGYYTITGDSAGVVYKVTASAATNVNKVVTDLTIDWTKTPATGALYVVAPCGDRFVLSEVKTLDGKVTMHDGTYVYVDGAKKSVSATEATIATESILGAITDLTIGTGKLDFTNTFRFYLNAAGQIFAAVALTDAAVVEWTPVYVVGTTETDLGANAFGTHTYEFNVQYYGLDGKVVLDKYVALDGDTVVHSGATTGKVNFSDLSPAWYLIAKTANGNALKSLNTSTAVEGYKLVADFIASTSAFDKDATSFNGSFVTKETVFLYSTVTDAAANNTAATVVTGAHDEALTDNTVVKALVKANASNPAKTDIVAAWVGEAKSASTATADNVYVIALDGQITAANVATGMPATYQYTVLNAKGEIEKLVVTDSSASGAKRIIENANGTKSFGSTTWTTDVIANVTSADLYVVNGVTYVNQGTEYVVGTPIVKDIRPAVLAGLADGISSFNGMLGAGVSATCVYTTNLQTGVMTLALVIIDG